MKPQYTIHLFNEMDCVSFFAYREIRLNKRKNSDLQENQIRSKFAESGVVFEVRDNSSGSARNDGDGLSEKYYLSCKFRCKKSFSLSEKDFIHDVNQSVIWNKTPIWCLRNSSGTDLVAMRLEDFLRLIKDTYLKEASDAKEEK